MKHVKEIVLERRNLKGYSKYTDILKTKFSNFLHIEKIVSYEEDNEISIEIKTWNGFKKDFINYINDQFGNPNYKINPANGAQLLIYIYDVPKSFFEELDIELNTEKYNL